MQCLSAEPRPHSLHRHGGLRPSPYPGTTLQRVAWPAWINLSTLLRSAGIAAPLAWVCPDSDQILPEYN